MWSKHSEHAIFDILHALLVDLKCISDSDKDSLIRPVTKVEVFKTLCSFPARKSPRPNGLNAEVY